jgi:hypothetical protein
MHQQIKGSPGDTASNIRAVVNALGNAGVNIEAIAPDFDPPHVRVLVDHAEPYDPSDDSDPFNKALVAMQAEGFAPEIKPSVLVNLPNKPRALQAALDRITREGYVVESILVLPGGPSQGVARVSFGVARTTIDGWDQTADALSERIQEVVDNIP